MDAPCARRSASQRFPRRVRKAKEGSEAVSVSPIPQVAQSSGRLEVSSFAGVGFSDVRFKNIQETLAEKQNQRRNHFHG